jgi:hypothetical protein
MSSPAIATLERPAYFEFDALAGSPDLPRDRTAVPDELAAALFASLPRSDQRRHGLRYLQGLLEVEGRKSARSVAAWIGDPTGEQSLHHFINSSSWDWSPVRRALAAHMMRAAEPQAWIVRTLVIPKAGTSSVGVDRRFVASLGQAVNAQQAVGVWAASSWANCPVTWRLRLSRGWLDDQRRRSQASIPAGLRPESWADCIARAALEPMRAWGMPALPVVLDGREADAPGLIRRLRAARVPVLARISSLQPLVHTEWARLGRTEQMQTAAQVLRVFQGVRRPMAWARGGEGLVTSAVKVRLPGPGPTGTVKDETELYLLGVEETHRGRPPQYWLTDLDAGRPVTMLRLRSLAAQVGADAGRIGDRVGLRDFTGRSFAGWHRHATLASAAYAVRALSGPAKSDAGESAAGDDDTSAEPVRRPGTARRTLSAVS